MRSAFIMAAGSRRCVPCAAVSALSVGLCRGLISAQVAVWQRVARIKISYAELKKLFYFVFSLTYVIFADDLNRDLIMKIALIGYGKMGKMIEQIALGRGHQIVSIIDIDNQQDFDSEAFASADVAIEFTNPTAAYGNYLRAFAHNVKVVSGSTGWMKDHGDDVRKMCAEGGQTLFWASNFSIGVAIFSAVNRYLAKIMNGFPQYSVTMEETHHVHKLDAPSGTAITLAEEIIDNLDRKDSWVKGTLTAPDGHIEGSADCADNELRIDSVRRGEVPGIHTIAYDSEADCITITHDAHSRKGFALLMPAALYDPAVEGEELMLQGVVDCAFRTGEGLVVVDFKTDRLASGEEPQRAEEYRPQLEAYAQALERVMEEKVCRKVLYFFSTGATINL